MRKLILWVYGAFYRHSETIYKKFNITESDLYDVRWWADYKKKQRKAKK